MSTLAFDWSDVETTTGGAFGEFDAACPVCGPNRKSPFNQRRKVLRVWRTEPDFATWFCARCGNSGWARAEAGQQPVRGQLWRTLYQPAPVDPEAAERERLARIARLEFTYFSADPIAGSPGEAYLASRGLTPGEGLRFGPRTPHGYADTVATGPAMVAAVRDLGGALAGVQATFLAGTVKTKRLTFGRVGGAAVRLAPHADVLAVAEGVETALAFTALYGVPCWAALSAIGVAQFAVPGGISRLVIAADPDDTGIAAARTLAKRASQHCEVVISTPKQGDWADVLAGAKRLVTA